MMMDGDDDDDDVDDDDGTPARAEKKLMNLALEDLFFLPLHKEPEEESGIIPQFQCTVMQ